MISTIYVNTALFKAHWGLLIILLCASFASAYDAASLENDFNVEKDEHSQKVRFPAGALLNKNRPHITVTHVESGNQEDLAICFINGKYYLQIDGAYIPIDMQTVTDVTDEPSQTASAVQFISSQPAFVTPQPSFVTPQPSFVPPQPSFVPPQSGFVSLQPGFVPPQPGFVPPQPIFFPPQPIPAPMMMLPPPPPMMMFPSPPPPPPPPPPPMPPQVTVVPVFPGDYEQLKKDVAGVTTRFNDLSLSHDDLQRRQSNQVKETQRYRGKLLQAENAQEKTKRELERTENEVQYQRDELTALREDKDRFIRNAAAQAGNQYEENQALIRILEHAQGVNRKMVDRMTTMMTAEAAADEVKQAQEALQKELDQLRAEHQQTLKQEEQKAKDDKKQMHSELYISYVNERGREKQKLSKRYQQLLQKQREEAQKELERYQAESKKSYAEAHQQKLAALRAEKEKIEDEKRLLKSTEKEWQKELRESRAAQSRLAAEITEQRETLENEFEQALLKATLKVSELEKDIEQLQQKPESGKSVAVQTDELESEELPEKPQQQPVPESADASRPLAVTPDSTTGVMATTVAIPPSHCESDPLATMLGDGEQSLRPSSVCSTGAKKKAKKRRKKNKSEGSDGTVPSEAGSLDSMPSSVPSPSSTSSPTGPDYDELEKILEKQDRTLKLRGHTSPRAKSDKEPSMYADATLQGNMATVMALPANDKKAGDVVKLLIEQLRYQISCWQANGNRPQMEKYIGMLFRLINRFLFALPNRPPTALLNNAFIQVKNEKYSDRSDALSLDADSIYLAVKKILTTEGKQFGPEFDRRLPTTFSDPWDILRTLQALLYALMTENYRFLLKVVDLIPQDAEGADVSQALSRCYYNPKNASSASVQVAYGIFQHLIYIQRVAEQLFDRWLHNDVWSDLSPQDAEYLLFQLKALLSGAGKYQKEFLIGDKRGFPDSAVKALPPSALDMSTREWQTIGRLVKSRAHVAEAVKTRENRETGPSAEDLKTALEMVRGLQREMKRIRLKTPKVELASSLDPDGLLRRLGLQSNYTPADGYCMFHAIIQGTQIEGINSVQELIQAVIAEAMQENAVHELMEQFHQAMPSIIHPSTTLDSVIDHLYTITNQENSNPLDNWGTHEILALVPYVINQNILLILTSYEFSDEHHVGLLMTVNDGSSLVTEAEIQAHLGAGNQPLILGFASLDQSEMYHWFHVSSIDSTVEAVTGQAPLRRLGNSTQNRGDDDSVMGTKVTLPFSW